MATHYFSAIKAAIEEEWVLAEKEIKRAGELGLEARVVDNFLASRCTPAGTHPAMDVLCNLPPDCMGPGPGPDLRVRQNNVYDDNECHQECRSQ